jgi:hypothetical protein
MISTKGKKRLAAFLTGGGAVAAAALKRCRGRQQGHEAAVTEPAPQTPRRPPQTRRRATAPPKEVHSDADAV